MIDETGGNSSSSEMQDDLSKRGLNILGDPLEKCSSARPTGYRRDDYCRQDPADPANHTVCALLTGSFLDFTRSKGNALPGLSPGGHWCICSARYLEAAAAGVAPPIVDGATHASFSKARRAPFTRLA